MTAQRTSLNETYISYQIVGRRLFNAGYRSYTPEREWRRETDDRHIRYIDRLSMHWKTLFPQMILIFKFLVLKNPSFVRRFQ